MLILALILPLVHSCYYDQEVEEEMSTSTVSFSADIQPIFSKNCNVCHPLLNAVPDFTEGSSYNSLIDGNYVISNDFESSVLYQRLMGNPSVMPPSGSLPDSQISLVKTWIEQGALNN